MPTPVVSSRVLLQTRAGLADFVKKRYEDANNGSPSRSRLTYEVSAAEYEFREALREVRASRRSYQVVSSSGKRSRELLEAAWNQIGQTYRVQENITEMGIHCTTYGGGKEVVSRELPLDVSTHDVDDVARREKLLMQAEVLLRS